MSLDQKVCDWAMQTICFAMSLRASDHGRSLDRGSVMPANAEAERVTARLVEAAGGDVAKLVASVFSWWPRAPLRLTAARHLTPRRPRRTTAWPRTTPLESRRA